MQLIERLEDAGYRVTGTRKRVCELLAAHAEGVSAEELVAEAKGIGRATVYRTIDVLVQEQLLCRIPTEGSSRYALARASHHHHMVCIGCGLVREFRDPTLEKALRRLRLPGTEVVIGHQVDIQVLCGTCQEKPDKRRLAQRLAGAP